MTQTYEEEAETLRRTTGGQQVSSGLGQQLHHRDGKRRGKVGQEGALPYGRVASAASNAGGFGSPIAVPLRGIPGPAPRSHDRMG